jgi:hypothetical protein
MNQFAYLARQVFPEASASLTRIQRRPEMLTAI